VSAVSGAAGVERGARNAPDSDSLVSLHQRMLLARRLEERLQRDHNEGKIPATLYLSTGQEAVGIGVGEALQPGDIVRSWVRGISQALGRRMPLGLLCSEILGRETGGMKGRGGVQFLGWREGGFLGGTGVVGSVLSVAAGHAMALRLRGSAAVTCCFFGEGGVQIGLSHEAFNLAGLWKLPIIFVCENNGYALSASWPVQTAGLDVVSRASVSGLRGVQIDGNRVEEVYAATREAREAALAGEPTLIEARTYRLAPFSTGETGELGSYVPESERAQAWERDPLLLSWKNLKLQGLASDENLRFWEEGIEREIAEALEFAYSSAFPDPSEYVDGVLD
jgi:TPP-dependent pyruvate/acetoin dehydrogenase alpha subunit